MENISIKAGERTPSVEFRFHENHLAMSGESYPEDTAAFFGPILGALSEYCESTHHPEITFDIALSYFNTSSAKVLMNLIQILEGRARSGTAVHVNWFYQQEDEMLQEFGEDFSRDLEHVQFQLIAIHS
jgi:SiaC family regulatory phosphoprotein